MERVGGAVTVVDEVHGFRFFEDRDLLGFVDGTENPDGPRGGRGPIGDEDPDFAGGSYVHVQKYLHDMTAWNALRVTEQELVIGRTKLEDIELDDDGQAGRTRTSRSTRSTTRTATSCKIVRAQHAVRHVGNGESGTYYIGYVAQPRRHRADVEQHVHRRSARATPTASWTSRPR